jgi:hypothetical protein
MAAFHAATAMPCCDEFVGPYALGSPAYIASMEHAAVPVIYEAIVIGFTIEHDLTTPVVLSAGSPVTVTFGRYGDRSCGLGYAYYGMTREVWTSGEDEDGVYTAVVIVELHVTPGHSMKWHFIGALLWFFPPLHIRYIQPHNFLSRLHKCPDYHIDSIPFLPMHQAEVNHDNWWNECIEAGIMGIPHPLPLQSYPHFPPYNHEIIPHRLLRSPTPTGQQWEEVYICSPQRAERLMREYRRLYLSLGLWVPEEEENVLQVAM